MEARERQMLSNTGGASAPPDDCTGTQPKNTFLHQHMGALIQSLRTSALKLNSCVEAEEGEVTKPPSSSQEGE